MDKKKNLQEKSYNNLSEEEKNNYKEKVVSLFEKLFNDKPIISKLTFYTTRLISNYTKNETINGKEAKDFIQEATLKIIEGERY